MRHARSFSAEDTSMRALYSGLPAAASVEQSILLAQLELLRRHDRAGEAVPAARGGSIARPKQRPEARNRGRALTYPLPKRSVHVSCQTSSSCAGQTQTAIGTGHRGGRRATCASRTQVPRHGLTTSIALSWL